MARVVVHEKSGPLMITADMVGKSFCQCGLSDQKPFCDGSHCSTFDEEEGKLYQYSESERKEVSL
ncbi:MAG: CDGSH iron-sulfur domain-containing protein [Nanoarchaeota archaeon]